MPGGVYVYGVVDDSRAASYGPVGVGQPGAEVRTLPFRSIGILISDAPSGPIRATGEDPVRHLRVLERAMQDHVVIPAAFGTFAVSERELVDLMSAHYGKITEAIRRLRGKAEVGVKAFWSREAVARHIEQEVGSLERLRVRVASDPQHGRQLAVEVGRRVERILDRWRETHIASIVHELRRVAAEVKVNEPIGLQMLLNAACLVEKERVPGLETAIQELGDRYSEVLTFRYTSPLPPFNFVDLRLSPGSVGS